jgi:hypothetical protein
MYDYQLCIIQQSVAAMKITLDSPYSACTAMPPPIPKMPQSQGQVATSLSNKSKVIQLTEL